MKWSILLVMMLSACTATIGGGRHADVSIGVGIVAYPVVEDRYVYDQRERRYYFIERDRRHYMGDGWHYRKHGVPRGHWSDRERERRWH